jgi:hypothetical protein
VQAMQQVKPAPVPQSTTFDPQPPEFPQV